VLFYADNINGLWSYDPSTELWTTGDVIDAGQDITDADVKFVMSHKNNVWFAARGSAVGYFLPILSNKGTVTAAFFGDKFKHGGTLEGLFSWTVDGGSGVDDMLVAVSHAGDVVVYQGSDPDDALGDWGMQGIYYVGEIPRTPRFATQHGGELHILSAYGLTGMGDLLKGVDTASMQADSDGTSMAYKIAGLIRDKMKSDINERGWDVTIIPTEGGILISTPTTNNLAPIQYYYNIATQGWCLWRDVPMTCFTEYKESVYFGTADGRIMRMDVDTDNYLIDPPDPLNNGDDIEFSILTAYSSNGVDGIYKRTKLIRADFLSSLPPVYSSQARYDYDIAEGLNFQLDEQNLFGIGVWDQSVWDGAVWGSDTGTNFAFVGGAWGYGRYIAIATKGSSRSNTRLVGWDLVFDIGGPMI
jgi:hypothetical protein